MAEGSIYLQPSEYATYGLPATVTEAMVRAAGGHIDGYLSRPRGLVWSPDAGGVPAYMAGAATFLKVLGAGTISVGANVVVPYTGPPLDNNSVGEIVILDKTNTGAVEACVVQATNATPQTLTLKSVKYQHADQCTIEFGLTLCEQKDMPKDRSSTLLSEWPVMKVGSGVGRYGYARRSAQVMGAYQDFNLLATVSNFGGPPLWIPWAPEQSSINVQTGEIWVPAGILLAYYTEVKIWYVAGFRQEDLPWNIKQATANIVNMLKETGLGANIRRREQPGQVAANKFENNMIDANTRELLTPFRARNFV